MKSETENILRRLTKNQAKVLKVIVEHSVIASGASGLAGPMLGGTVSALERKGIIRPMGRDKRQLRWELFDENIKEDVKENKQTLLDLLRQLENS